MKCDKCGYSDNGTGDWAHACGPVAVQQKSVANDRIRELHNLACRIDMEQHPDAIPDGERIQQKFAELIIENACRALNPMLRDMISRGQAVDLIKQHFGVEQ